MSTVAEGRMPVRTPQDIPQQDARDVPAEAAPAPGGDPAMLGLPVFIVGSVALGLALIGVLPATAAAGTLPIIVMATGLGLWVTTLWAIRLGQSALACVFGVFAGFWTSYAVLLLGLGHDWFGIPADDVPETVSVFLLSWAIAVAVLTLVTLRLPVAFTALFVLVDLALVLLLLGNENTSTTLNEAAGYVVLAFAALGVYLFAGAASVATGGRALPLGKPVVR